MKNSKFVDRIVMFVLLPLSISFSIFVFYGCYSDNSYSTYIEYSLDTNKSKAK
jgi:uncharacterized protein with PQ loop repeat